MSTTASIAARPHPATTPPSQGRWRRSGPTVQHGNVQHGNVQHRGLAEESVTTLVQRAVDGDETAWTEIVRRYETMIWAVTRRCGLPPTTGADVVQTTWLRFSERAWAIREPEHLGGWLMTVAQREAWRTRQAQLREVSTEDAMLEGHDKPVVEPVEDTVVRQDQAEAVHTAISRLPARQRDLMRMLVTNVPPSYEEISRRTGMPIGSIGPTRARALAKLRTLIEASQPTHAGVGRSRAMAVAV